MLKYSTQKKVRDSKSFRLALGTLIIKEKLGTSDRETIEQIVDNYVFLDRISWENFNESGDLKSQVEKFKQTYGYYPESVHVDKIYRTRENLAWCKERGIRISGPKLGRPPKNVSKQDKKQAQDDEGFRNAIEGKFGQAKRRFSLNLVMTKLPETSETSIAITFLVVNLSRLLRQFLLFYLSLFLNYETDELNKKKIK